MANDETYRTETFPFGIAGAGLGTVTRRVPRDEPPPLPPNAELTVIGRSVPRHDAVGKVTGATPFTVDVVLPHQLYGRILRSPHAHARVRAIDVAAAEGHPGVSAVLIVAAPDDPLRATVRYIGAPVAALAAASPAIAEAAARLIHVEYEELPFVADPEAAREPGAPPVYDPASAPRGYASGFPAPAGLPLDGNVRGPATSGRGDVATGFTQADTIVEAEYCTHVQTHCCLEPHAIVADWRNDGLTVYQSTQFTAGVREELAEEFGLPLNRIRVVVDGMGGGFGSKSSLGTYGRIAVRLSRAARAPVRIVLERHEEQIDAGNRPGTFQHLRVGAKLDGSLTAIALVSYGTAGFGLGAGVGSIAETSYACPHVESAQYDVFINAGPGCAMRGPGNTPGAFALEQSIDELADRLGIDPLALRDRIDRSPVRREERRIGAHRIGWERRQRAGAERGPLKRGLGVAQSLWPANVALDASCEVRVLRDGTVEVLSSVQDIGTGITTVLAQTVAEVFGLRSDAVTVRIGDTEFPAGGPSYGSRTTASVTPAARTAAWRVLQKLLCEAAKLLDVPPGELLVRNGRIATRRDPARGIAFRDACARLRTARISAIASRRDDYGGFRRRLDDAALATQDLGGVQFAEVVVDTETGRIRVERVVAVQDCGRPMHPRQIESQVQGGVLMGLSYALFEERVLDRSTGRMLNDDLEQYKLAGITDAPDIDVVVLEEYRAESATDAYGIAEPSNIATAPAIANAVFNATGVRVRTLPMTPAAVLRALERTPVGAAAR